MAKTKTKRNSSKAKSINDQISQWLLQAKKAIASQDLEGRFVQCTHSLTALKKKILLLTQQHKTSGKAKKWNRLLADINKDSGLRDLLSTSFEYVQPQLKKLYRFAQHVLDLPSTAEISALNHKISALDKKITELLENEDLDAKPANGKNKTPAKNPEVVVSERAGAIPGDSSKASQTGAH